jgi:hypothetical protein
MTPGTASKSYWRSTTEDGSATVPATVSLLFRLQLWGPWPRECTWMANPSASGGEGMPTRSNLSHFSITLVGDSLFHYCYDCSYFSSFGCQCHLTPRPGAFQGNVTCTRPKTHPIQGSFDPRPLGHYLFFSFLCLLRANLALLLITPRQTPLFGFPTPKPGNAPSQPR